QKLEVRWLSNSSGLKDGRNLYEIQIGRTENLTIVYSVSNTYSWTWTSSLPLECADHSVRIRRFYNQSLPSPWSEWMTNYGEMNNTRIFPFQRVLREGASTMLCCVPPRGVHITGMAFNGSQYPLISIGDRVKAISVKNLTIPARLFQGVLFSCNDTTAETNKCFNYISFPPQKPESISCSTTDLKTVNCIWDPGRKSNLVDPYRRTHTLHIANSDQEPIKCKESSCHFPAVPHLDEYNISVVVGNQLGEERESYCFNISDRVLPALEWTRVWPGVTNSTLSWIIQGNLSGLDILCQVVTNQESTIMVSFIRYNYEMITRDYCKVKLGHLLPNTHYSARARCAVKGKLWGDWAQPIAFTTYPLVTLDVWRRVEQLSSNSLRKVTLFWTPHVPGLAASNIIQGYTVRWTQGGRNGTEWKDNGQAQAEIIIGAGRCDFSVQAVVRAGSSIPDHITIPQTEDRGEHGNTTGALQLTWAEYDHATCGYTVEWCIVGTVTPCTLQWRKVPEGNNSLLLPARNFEAGYRYTFNIYGCTENGHRLLEIQTGYIQELKSVQSPSLVGAVRSTSSSVTLEWLYDEDDQAGFITGYLASVQEVGQEAAPVLLNVTVADPRRKSVTIEGLQESREYTVYLSALTKKGRGPPATITIRTKANYTVHLVKILIPVLLLLCCTILLWPQRTMVKSGLKGILSYPAGMNIRTIEIDIYTNAYLSHACLHSPQQELAGLQHPGNAHT
uniref:Fibronectin type-III domain-containing protein n=1 Tax=Myripristis murdjan TaxID=586833 RepID=A0A667ZXB3_9TELE